MHTDLPSGIRIDYAVHGSPSAPAIVLITGLGLQMTAWPTSFIEGLAARGFRVVTFDNRDAGLSSRATSAKRIDLRAAALKGIMGFPVQPPYTLEDMGSDAIGLMEKLNIDRAHVLGISMGGMIGQVLAAKHRERLRSLTSIMSSSGAMRFSFHMSPATRALLSPPPRNATEEQMLDHTEHIWMLIGSPGLQPPRDVLRERLRQSMQRAYNPAGVARQMLAIMASGDRRRLLRTIETPTLVIHGDRDTLVPIGAGRDTAANIPGASFHEVKGMGHDLPEPLVPMLVDLVAGHCIRADGAVAERAA
jgi:proline iminopeptidase